MVIDYFPNTIETIKREAIIPAILESIDPLRVYLVFLIPILIKYNDMV